MSILVISEKPSLGRAIANAVNGIKVLPAGGHLYQFNYPNTEKWETSNLPLQGLKTYELIPINDSFKKQCRENITKTLKSGITEVVSAGDDDPEGSLLIYEILVSNQLIGFDFNIKKNIKITRMYSTEMDNPSLKRAFDKRVPIDKDYPYVKSAIARTFSDAIVGFNLTQLTSLKMGEFLSVGRVQTPTLSIIKEREDERENFVPKKYQKGVGTFDNGATGELITRENGEENSKLPVDFNPQSLQKLVNTNHPFRVKEIRKEAKKTNPPFLPNHADILKAGKFLKVKMNDVNDALQRLYEKAFISYPRTEVNFLPSSMADDVRPILEGWAKLEGVKNHQLIKDSPRIYDDKKLKGESHYAIIPITIKPILEKGSVDQIVFNHIKNLFLMAFMKPYQYEVTTAYIDDDNFVFKCTGSIEKDLGFKKIMHTKKEDKLLPDIQQNLILHLQSFSLNQEQTNPPPVMTNSELASIMDNVSRRKKNQIIEKDGDFSLGAPSTRVNIINTLVQRKYVTLKGVKEEIKTTKKGRKMLAFIEEDLEINLTARFDIRLKAIRKKEDDYMTFINDIENFTNKIIEKKRDLPEPKKNYEDTTQMKKGEILSIKKEDEIVGFKTLVEELQHVIWCNFLGAKIDEKNAKKLFNGEPIALSGLKSKKGTTFEANVVYNFDQKKLNLIFQNSAKEGEIVSIKKDGKVIGFKSLIENQEHVIWCNFLGAKINEKMVKKLFKGETISLSGLKSKKGSTFEANVVYNFDQKKLSLVFA